MLDDAAVLHPHDVDHGAARVLAGHLAAIAFAIQVAAVLFSLVGPVPINNRTKLWTPTNLPSNWEAQERRWDLYHWIRTCGLIVAFALLVVGALR